MLISKIKFYPLNEISKNLLQKFLEAPFLFKRSNGKLRVEASMDIIEAKRRHDADPENVSAKARYLQELIRSGKLPEINVKIAASLNDPASKILYPDENLDMEVLFLEDREVMVDIGIWAAEQAVDYWEDLIPDLRLPYPYEYIKPRDQIAKAIEWQNNPTDDNLDAVIYEIEQVGYPANYFDQINHDQAMHLENAIYYALRNILLRNSETLLAVLMNALQAMGRNPFANLQDNRDFMIEYLLRV